MAASLSVIRPQASLLVGAGALGLSGVPRPFRERRVAFAVGSGVDQQHHDPRKPKKSTRRTIRSTAKRDDIVEGAKTVVHVEAQPAQSQRTSSALCIQDLCVDLKTADDIGPRFRDLQSVEPTSDMESLPVAPMMQDVSEETKVEARHTPRRPFASQEDWTPPSPPPSPPRRRNGYLRESPAIQEVQPADAVDEVQQAPAQGAPEGGGLVGSS